MPEAQPLGGFGQLDWAVVAGFLLLVTYLGHRLSGRQASIRDFFLGGRRLPWYAVSASIVATEISAVTLIALPSVVFREGGNLTYLQIGLFGSLVARWVIAVFLVPAYYEREIYSPYDYMGARLGRGVRGVTTALFAGGQILAQAARVYLIAVVLEVILHRELGWLQAHTGLPPLVGAVTAMGVVSLAWTLMGGIATVVWTDALLFLVFLAAIAISLVTVLANVPGGAAEVIELGQQADKFQLLDFSLDRTKAYTIWTALVAQSWAGVGAYGVDQLMAQRLFCCRGVREARKAIVASYAGMLVTTCVGLVGIALYAYYQHQPLGGEALALYQEKPDRIFPIFVLQAVPAGLRGLILAGAFAAAISSLDSILAALSQTVLSALVLPWRERLGRDPEAPEEMRFTLRASRVLVVVFGVLLCACAIGANEAARHYPSVLDLALAMAGYTQGALLAGFVLAYGKASATRALGSGFVWSAPLSVLCVFVVKWQQGAARTVLWGALAVLLVMWLFTRVRREGRRALEASAWLGACMLAIVLLQLSGFVVAWPWYVPIGFLYALLAARPLARRLDPRTPGTPCAAPSQL